MLPWASAAGPTRALATGPVRLVPELRLNALMVLANRTDQGTIDWLINHVLDIEQPPDDIAITPKPQRVEVKHARAADIAEVLREVYADRMVLSQTQQARANMMSAGGPLGVMMGGMTGMFAGGGEEGGRGGRGGRGGGGGNQQTNANKVAIGVDPRTNSLIIAAPEALFAEVKKLIEELDQAAASDNETVQVVNLHHTARLRCRGRWRPSPAMPCRAAGIRATRASASSPTTTTSIAALSPGSAFSVRRSWRQFRRQPRRRQ